MKRPGMLAALALSLAPHTGAMEPLTTTPGDPAQGRAAVLDRERGHCLLCHRIDQVDEGFQGTIGPALSGVGNRLGPAQLRARVVDPTRLNPATAMPAYHRVEGLRQVAREYRGEPILTAQEVEDVVAFLATLVLVESRPESKAQSEARTPARSPDPRAQHDDGSQRRRGASAVAGTAGATRS